MMNKGKLPMFESYQENKEAYDAQSMHEGSEIWNKWYAEKDDPSEETLKGIFQAMAADRVIDNEQSMMNWLEGFTGFDKAMADNLLTQMRAKRVVEGFGNRAKFGDLNNPDKALGEVVSYIEKNYSVSDAVMTQVGELLYDDVYFDPNTGEMDEESLEDIANMLRTNTRDLGTELSQVMADRALEAKEDVRPLPKEYKHSGMTFQQVARTKKAAIYKEKDSETYEVFLIKTAKATTIKAGGKMTDVPARERIPGNNDFGVWAWSYTSKDAAERKFNEFK